MDMQFSDLGVPAALQEALAALGITAPTAVQTAVIPLVAQRKNVLFQSETGTGKTFAYLLPLVARLLAEPGATKDARVLIASPTYELASQIKAQVQRICTVKAVLCIGGAPISRQIEALKEKPEIVIGSPARLLELIHLKKLRAHAVQALVLDETDRLLSPELREATKGLLDRLSRDVQLIGNSATVSEYTRKILLQARNGGDSPADGSGAQAENITLVQMPPQDVLRKRIEHWALFAERRDKIDTLRSLINAEKAAAQKTGNRIKMLVFTGRSDQIDNIVSKLRYKNIDCAGLSAKTDKKERKAAIDRFRSGKIRILVTTDLTSRGLDIPGITHVVQMDLPEQSDFFVHRAGRTARAGSTGINCVIGDAWELQHYARLEKKLGITVHPKQLYGGKVVAPPQDGE